MERIGLIAGGGKLPLIFAEEVRKKGIKVIGFALNGMTSPDFNRVCDKVHWFETSQAAKFLFMLVAERIRKAVMLGKVDKSVIYGKMEENQEILNTLKSVKDKSDYAVLDKITAVIEKTGVKIIDPVSYLSELLPRKGVLTKKKPTDKELEDISFGIKTAKEMARMDIGQTIIVKDKSVIGVEAMEGTDRTIERAANICGEGFIVVKVSRPEQDMRWDVPVVGLETVRLVARNKGKVLVLEEKKMFLVDKSACVELADSSDISIVVV